MELGVQTRLLCFWTQGKRSAANTSVARTRNWIWSTPSRSQAAGDNFSSDHVLALLLSAKRSTFLSRDLLTNGLVLRYSVHVEGASAHGTRHQRHVILPRSWTLLRNDPASRGTGAAPSVEPLPKHLALTRGPRSSCTGRWTRQHVGVHLQLRHRASTVRAVVQLHRNLRSATLDMVR